MVFRDKQRSIRIKLIIKIRVQLVLEQCKGEGHRLPCSQKSVFKFWLLKNFDCPSVSTRDWFQEPPQTPKPENAQGPCTKWHRPMHIVSPLQPQIKDSMGIYWKKQQQPMYKWTHTFQTILLKSQLYLLSPTARVISFKLEGLWNWDDLSMGGI